MRASPLLESRALDPLARQLGVDARAVGQLRARGTAALPVAIEVLLDGSASFAARQAASDVASSLIGTERRLRGDGGDERALAAWSEWWFQQRREHVRFSRGERLIGHLTETQFAKWIGRVVTLRFGTSLRDGRPVTEKLGEALPVTLLLSLISMVLAYLCAVPLGVHAAVRQGTLAERLTTVVLFVLYSLPSFWVAMVLILLFGGVGHLDWFPIYGLSSPGLETATGWTWLADRLHHLVLPVVCLTYGSLAVLSRYQRSAMLEVIRQDYIRTARAKGLGERSVIFKHALRNALLPTITLLGLQLPYLIGGSVIIERIFNVPGMGLLTFQAFLHRDYPVIMAVSVLSAALTLLGLILADLFYAVADPRITLEARR
jgi:peptide/nickel transport system permease protein